MPYSKKSIVTVTLVFYCVSCFLLVSMPSRPAITSPVTPPPRYDLRGVPGGQTITPVRNQGDYNLCWVFAALASLESNILLKSGVVMDFSEAQLAQFALSVCVQTNEGILVTEDSVFNRGASWLLAAAVLASGVGPVAENGAYGPGVFAEEARFASDAFLTAAEGFSISPGDQSYQGRLKRMVMSNGAVYLSYRHPAAGEGVTYDPKKATLYSPYPADSNHAAVVAGWDDAYPASAFTVQPPADGAWLMKNSWGTSFGDAGYYWISYWDATIAAAVSFQGMPCSDEDAPDGRYQHDTLGYSTVLNLESGVYSAANVFTASGNERLTRIGFYTVEEDTEWTVNIYLNPDPSLPGYPANGTLCATREGSCPLYGYHTAGIVPVRLSEGDVFAVVMTVTPGAGRLALIPIESASYTADGAEYFFSSGWGESFVLANGSYRDVKSIGGGWNNVPIKAFTKRDPAAGTLPAAGSRSRAGQ